MDPLMILLRALHIGAGVLWVGAGWTMFLFVQPTLQAMDPPTQNKFMGYIVKQRRLSLVIQTAAIVVLLAGAAMYIIDISRATPQVWFGSLWGIGLTIGSIGALAAFALGATMVGPSVTRMAKVGGEVMAAGGPPTESQRAELEQLGLRLRRVFTWDFVLLVVAVLFMAISRYL